MSLAARDGASARRAPCAAEVSWPEYSSASSAASCRDSGKVEVRRLARCGLIHGRLALARRLQGSSARAKQILECVERLERLARRQGIRARFRPCASSRRLPRAAGARRPGRTEERQIVDKLRPLRPAVVLLEDGQHFGARGDDGRAVRRAWPHGCRRSGRRRPASTSCRNTISPCHSLHLHGGVGDGGKLVGERRQLVIMGGEESAAAIDLVQMLQQPPRRSTGRRRSPCRGRSHRG